MTWQIVRDGLFLFSKQGEKRKGSSYGVGLGASGADDRRRWVASATRLSRSFSFGTTCLATRMLSNSLWQFDIDPSARLVSASASFPRPSYLAFLRQLLRHLRLDLLQHRLRLLRHRRVTSREVVPFQLAQRALQALRVELLEASCAGAGDDGRCWCWCCL